MKMALMAEWSKVLRSGRNHPMGDVGSNPTQCIGFRSNKFFLKSKCFLPWRKLEYGVWNPIGMSLSCRHIRNLLANAFFLNTTENESMKLGNLNFMHVYTSTRGKERVCCLLSYFLQEAFETEKKDDMVGFSRRLLLSGISGMDRYRYLG